MLGTWSLKAKLAILSLLVASAGGAIGAQRVLVDPSRAPQTLPGELAGAFIARGTPLPRGVALVRRAVRIGAGAPQSGHVTLSCPEGYKATQLLGLGQALQSLSLYLLPVDFRPMAHAHTTVTYSASASVSTTRAEVGIVCRTWAAYARDRQRIRDLRGQFRDLSRRYTAGPSAALVATASHRGVVVDPSPQIPAGHVEHGIYDRDLVGVPQRSRRHWRIEWWADRDRWHAITSDRTTGRIIAQSFGTAAGVTTSGRHGPPRQRSAALRPGPGADPAWTAFAASSGLLQLAGIRTVAGRPGVVLRALDTGPTSQELVVEPQTFRPLERTVNAGNTAYGRARQREVLVMRELLPAQGAARAALSHHSR